MVKKIANRQTKRFLFKQVDGAHNESSYQFFVRTKKRENETIDPVFLIDLKTSHTVNGNSFSLRTQELFEFSADSSKEEIIEHIISRMEEMNCKTVLNFAEFNGIDIDSIALAMPENEKISLKERFFDCDF